MCEAKLHESDHQNIRHRLAAVPVIAPNPPARRHKRQSDNYMRFWWTSCLTVLGTGIIVAWIPNLLSPDPPKGNIDGFVIPQLKKVSDTFRLHLLSEEEKGAAFAVFKNGEVVVDIWGGYADIEAWQPWEKSTVGNTFSLYNMAVSLSMGLLRERGLVDYDKAAAFYWPEFGKFNKEQITIRDILSEQSGLLRLNNSISILKLSDSKFLSEELARQEVTIPGYMRFDSDQGILELYIDQLVRRIDPSGRPLKQFFEEEFSSKLGLDFYVGLPLAEQHRAARVRGHGFSVVFEVIFAPLELIYLLLSYTQSTTFTEINSIRRLNDPGIRRLSVGSVSGFATARSLAQLYNDAILSGEQQTNSPQISKSTWEHMSQLESIHLNVGSAKTRGLYSNWSMTAAGQVRNSPKDTRLIGYSGFGGQYAYVDRDKNISIAYLTNYNSIYRSALDPRFESLLRALYENI